MRTRTHRQAGTVRALLSRGEWWLLRTTFRWCWWMVILGAATGFVTTR